MENGGERQMPRQVTSHRARWVILCLTCGGLFGQFYAFDIPSALNEQMKDNLVARTGISEHDYLYYFGLLYSVYSLPNVLLPLVLGIAVDRCGCRVLIAALSACVVLGQVIVAVGAGTASWATMLSGRVLFGVGAESIQVAQNCLIFRWFKGREVAFALGFNLSVARAGSVLNDLLSPRLSQLCGVVGTLWFGGILCFASFVCNVCSAVLDKSEGQRAGLPDDSNEEEFSLRQILRLPRLFWVLTALCVVLYCGIMPFNNIASAFFVETWYSKLPQATAQQRAGDAMSLLPLASALGTPPFGCLIDQVGMRSWFLMMSSFLLALNYASIFIAPPMASMLCLGVVYTTFAGALWPSFALTVPESQLGTAFGIAMALQNAGLALVALLVGHLQVESKGNFTAVSRLFMGFGLMGVCVSVMLLRCNKTSGGALDLPSSEAERHFKESECSALRAAVKRDGHFGAAQQAVVAGPQPAVK